MVVLGFSRAGNRTTKVLLRSMYSGMGLPACGVQKCAQRFHACLQIGERFLKFQRGGLACMNQLFDVVDVHECCLDFYD